MNKTSLGIVGIALAAILGLGLAGYTTLTPHSATMTMQQYLTNTQNVYTTQTQTIISTSTLTSAVVTNAAINLNSGTPGYYQTCGYYGCSPAQGYTYTPCTPTGSPTDNTVTCYGYLIRSGTSSCVQISVATTDPDYWRSGIFWVHYALQNLPSSYPPIGSWVNVVGQLNIVNTSMSVYSASCSPNTITVASISPTNAPSATPQP
jgi:hypothetical protein